MTIENKRSRFEGATRVTTGVAALFLMMMMMMSMMIPASLVAQSQPQKIAVIDVQRILEESVQGKKIIEELQQLQTEKASALQSLKDQVEESQRKLNEGRLTLSSDKLTEMEKELEDLMIRFQRMQDDAQRDLQKKQQDDFQKIEAQVMPIISTVGEELGYTLIFNKFQSGLVYASESVDITGIVVERFNASAGN